MSAESREKVEEFRRTEGKGKVKARQRSEWNKREEKRSILNE